MSRPTKGQKEFLDAVSSLKRAFGIPNHPTKRDEFKRVDVWDPECHIYTADAASAELLGELLYRIAVTPKGAAFYDSIRPRVSVRDSIKVQPVPEGGYEASMWVSVPEKFSEKVYNIIEKHIAPDKGGGRGR